MTDVDLRKITPWAPGRPSLYTFLKEREAELRAGNFRYLPCDAVSDAIRLPFKELVARDDLFFAVVEPAIEHPESSPDAANLYVRLMEKTIRESCLQSSITFYQLVLSAPTWLYATQDEIEKSLFRQGSILDDSRAYDFALWLLQNTPDEEPAKLSLSMLRYMSRTPPRDVVKLFAFHHRFSAHACSTLAVHFEDAEDDLIEIAKANDNWVRIHAIQCLRSVEKPENKTWLLREGYKNSLVMDYTVYSVAFHGDLIGRLRSHPIDLEELVDLANILAELSCVGPADVPRIDDYTDGPEAYGLLLEHCQSQPLQERLFWPIARIVNLLTKSPPADALDGTAIWNIEARDQIAAAGRAYLSLPGWSDEIQREWARWYNPPTVELLADGDLIRLHEVTDAAVDACEFEPVVDWAVEFLCLEKADRDRALRRRLQLEEVELAGVLKGGLANLQEDPKLRSVYGQVILQVLQMLENAPGIGWEVIEAALRSDTRLHRLTAATALQNWPPEQLSSEIFAALHVARRECDDKDALAAIDKLLLHEVLRPGSALQ